MKSDKGGYEIDVMNFGAGVQSTTMLLMSLSGELEKPDVVLFADTGEEPQAVYEHLEYMKRLVGDAIPFEIVTARRPGDQNRFDASMPLFSKHPESGKRIQLRRQCTNDFKIRPIRKRIKELLGVTRAKPGSVTNWLGISVDESHRMKDSDVKWSLNRYPLIEKMMTRAECIRWIQQHNYQIPQKSSCIMCPYHSVDYYRQLRKNAPADWGRLVEIEERLLKGVKGWNEDMSCHMHYSMIPLTQLVNEPEGQITFADLEGEECEGVCFL